MPSPRLLLLLFPLFFPSLTHSQDHPTTSRVPDACPVTKPSERPFVPPAPHPAKPIADRFWFGSDRLWTTLPANGTLRLGHYTSSDPTFREKLPFWRQGYDPHSEPRPNLKVSGKRIDAIAPPLQTNGNGNGSWTKNDQFIMTGINFPTAGCWKITGSYNDEELTFVVWVSP
jgi:hypothetical protein